MDFEPEISLSVLPSTQSETPVLRLGLRLRRVAARERLPGAAQQEIGEGQEEGGQGSGHVPAS